jgi:5-methyltetrahydropteroyltriglutamate--homocysteine methyltransferase
MTRPADDPLYPTMVVGSLPRPAAVVDVIQQRLHGQIDREQAERLLDDAVIEAIHLQEQAGLDYISDGEWRRENYARVFADKVAGFSRESIRRGPLTLLAVVVEKIEPREPIVCSEVAFLRQNTDRKILVALPSPCTVADLMWHPERSASVYPRRDDFIEACVPIIRAELIALSQLGVDAVQLDEPLLSRLANPALYALDPADLEAVVERSVNTINQVVEGLDAFTSVHLCHAHGEQRVIPGTEDLLRRAVQEMRVDRLAMEFNSPVAQQLQSLEDFPSDKLLGLGVIEPGNSQVESAELVVQRAQKALPFVDKERLFLNPDCGFATTASSSTDLEMVCRKLAALCEGARLLRSMASESPREVAH